VVQLQNLASTTIAWYAFWFSVALGVELCALLESIFGDVSQRIAGFVAAALKVVDEGD
jgi:hypothetical protein